MSHRQTISFLTRRFEEVGIWPATKHGQNFLIDLNLIELLANTANIDERDVVLEVGTGTGSLTALLARHAAHVVTVEIDARLHQLASEELIDFDNITMLRQDALKNKNNFHPHLLAAVREQLAESPQRRLKLAANLPYNIATPVVSNLLLTEFTPVSMTVTIQKELADRIMARPSTKDYSALSVWMQSLCDIVLVRALPPSVFWPRPKVHSAIIHIIPSAEKRAAIADLQFFHSFVRSMFFHRRKLLRREVLSAFKNQLDKPAVDEVMGELDLPFDARAEQLDIPRMLELGETLRRRVRQ